MRIEDAGSLVKNFQGQDLTRKIREIETAIVGAAQYQCEKALAKYGANEKAWAAAEYLKGIVGQIDVTIHALGILRCLPRLLEPNEIVQYVSLGAGNTGKKYDLETDQRVAEFKFIRWQGGAESVRQDSLFKDFYQMLEDPISKNKFLYTLGTEHPLKFLKSRRSLKSIMARQPEIKERFHKKFGGQYIVVGDFFRSEGHRIKIQDVSPWLSKRG